jgi:hypothetical protein
MKEKMYAILNKDDIPIDIWLAETFEEAQNDNPTCNVIEVTLENSPFTIGEKYIRKEQK